MTRDCRNAPYTLSTALALALSQALCMPPGGSLYHVTLLPMSGGIGLALRERAASGGVTSLQGNPQHAHDDVHGSADTMILDTLHELR